MLFENTLKCIYKKIKRSMNLLQCRILTKLVNFLIIFEAMSVTFHWLFGKLPDGPEINTIL